MAVVAGLLLMATFGWLGYCLWNAWRRYREVETEMGDLADVTA
jgi:hypothetical protein